MYSTALTSPPAVPNTTDLRLVVEAFGYRWALAVVAWDAAGHPLVAVEAGRLAAPQGLPVHAVGLVDAGADPGEVLDGMIVAPMLPRLPLTVPQSVLDRATELETEDPAPTEPHPLTHVHRALRHHRALADELVEDVHRLAQADQLSTVAYRAVRSLVLPAPPLTLAELAGRAGASEGEVAAAIDELGRGHHLATLESFAPHVPPIVAEADGLRTGAP